MFIVDELEFGVDARDGFEARLALLPVLTTAGAVGLFLVGVEESCLGVLVIGLETGVAGFVVRTGLLLITDLLGGLFVVNCLLLLRRGVLVGRLVATGEAVVGELGDRAFLVETGATGDFFTGVFLTVEVEDVVLEEDFTPADSSEDSLDTVMIKEENKKIDKKKRGKNKNKSDFFFI